MIVRMARSACGRRYTAHFARPVRIWSLVHNGNQAHERAIIDKISMTTPDVRRWPSGQSIEVVFGDRLKCCDIEIIP